MASDILRRTRPEDATVSAEMHAIVTFPSCISIIQKSQRSHVSRPFSPLLAHYIIYHILPFRIYIDVANRNRR